MWAGMQVPAQELDLVGDRALETGTGVEVEMPAAGVHLDLGMRRAGGRGLRELRRRDDVVLGNRVEDRRGDGLRVLAGPVAAHAQRGPCRRLVAPRRARWRDREETR